MKRVMKWFKENKIFAFLTASISTFVLGVVASADTPAAGTYQEVTNEIESVLTAAALTDVLKYAAAIAVVLVLLWWSIRKVVSIIKRAFMRGKLRL